MIYGIFYFYWNVSYLNSSLMSYWMQIHVGIPRCEEAWLFAATHAGGAGGGYHHIRCPPHWTELRRHTPQQQWRWAPFQEPEAVHGHPKPLSSSGVVEDLPWWSTNGWMYYCKGITFPLMHLFNLKRFWQAYCK